MSEKQAVYEAVADQLAEAGYIEDAVEMLGKGYESVRIEPERSVIRRVNGKMEAYDIPAFVKISTSFKSEMAAISGDALKVWLFIALSINRNTGKANPGLRTISENVKLAVNTVRKCLQELESLNLLTVDRQSRKYNIYETPEYVSANRSEPTVSSRDTVTETVSNFQETVSNSVETVSPSVILNQKNQNNQKQPKGDLVDLELSKLPAISIRKAISDYFKLNVNWDTKTSRQWMEWATQEGITAEQIERAADTWRMDKQFNWQVPTLKGIFEKWQMLMEAGKPQTNERDRSGMMRTL